MSVRFVRVMNLSMAGATRPDANDTVAASTVSRSGAEMNRLCAVCGPSTIASGGWLRDGDGGACWYLWQAWWSGWRLTRDYYFTPCFGALRFNFRLEIKFLKTVACSHR